MPRIDDGAAGTYVAIALTAVAATGAGEHARGEALAGGLPGLNRALGARVSPGEDRLATHVPLASAFALDPRGVAHGVLSAPSDVVRALIAVEAHLPDVPLHIGIGTGALAGPLSPDVTALHGPCLQAAREALTQGIRRRRWARVVGFGEAGDHVLNGMLAVIGALRSEWTLKQARTVRLARRHDTRRAVASELRVSPSVVTESLAAAHFDPLLEAEAALAALFGLFDTPGDALPSGG